MASCLFESFNVTALLMELQPPPCQVPRQGLSGNGLSGRPIVRCAGESCGDYVPSRFHRERTARYRFSTKILWALSRMPIASELSNLLSELRDALSFLSASLRRTFAESIFVATLVPGTLCRPQHALRYSGEDHQQLIPRYPGLQRRLLVGR